MSVRPKDADDGIPIQGCSHRRIRFSNGVFIAGFGLIGLSYLALIVLLLLADFAYMFTDSGNAQPMWDALAQEEIRNSLYLSMISCSVSACLAIIVAVPVGYLISRYQSRWLSILNSVLDIPIVLPPLVIGLSLLILFQYWPLSAPLGHFFPFDTPWDDLSIRQLVVYQVPAVILAQFTVATAFAIRTMVATFQQIDYRPEQVALTLGSSRFQALCKVVLPVAAPGILTAWTLAWARSLGEFGPLLIFAGATRNKTEVLSTSVFLELSIGNLEAAVAVSLIMVVAAVAVMVIARVWGRHEFIV